MTGAPDDRGPACPANAFEGKAPPPTLAGQAAYMREMAALIRKSPLPGRNTFLADVCDVVAATAEAVVTAQIAYIAGLREGARAREHARREVAAGRQAAAEGAAE